MLQSHSDWSVRDVIHMMQISEYMWQHVGDSTVVQWICYLRTNHHHHIRLFMPCQNACHTREMC